ncbi:MAG: PD-(D/E)XK nuclease family protein, partial [Tepidisphaeraceae bacterium]
AGDGQNAVRILSVHKSKGLEFPVVILPDLGKEHNLRDATEKIVVDDTVGIGLRVVDARKEIHYPSIASIIAQHEVRRRGLAEDLRVLYVAGTRAREQLIMIGSDAPDVASRWDEAWRGLEGPIPAGDVLAARTMLDWIGPAAAIAEAREPGSVERQVHEVATIEAIGGSLLDTPLRESNENPLADLRPLVPTPARTSAVESAIERLTYEYPYRAFTEMAAAEAVTTLTKADRVAPAWESSRGQGVVAFDQVLRLPRHLEANAAASGAEIGSITHAALQRLDFKRPCDDADLDAQLQGMVARRFLRKDQAPLVDKAAIQWFLTTDVARAFREMPHALRREFALTYSVPAPNAADLRGDVVMVRGRLDAVLVEPDGLTIIDYKTDRVTAATLDARIAFYLPQMTAYAQQIARVTHQPVKAVLHVFLTPRQVVRLQPPPCDEAASVPLPLRQALAPQDAPPA